MMMDLKTELFLLVSYVFIYYVFAQDQITVHPPHIAVEVGQKVYLQCHLDIKGNDRRMNEIAATLDWYMPNGTGPISKLVENYTTNAEFSRFNGTANGTLIMVNASLTDAGTYTCKNATAELEVQSIIKVYVMPNYMPIIYALIGVNVGLALLVLFCYAIKTKFYCKAGKTSKRS